MRISVNAIMIFVCGFILIAIRMCDAQREYKKYVEIDGCIYLEELNTHIYSDDLNRTLVGCDSLTFKKYKNKLDKNLK